MLLPSWTEELQVVVQQVGVQPAEGVHDGHTAAVQTDWKGAFHLQV